MKRPLLQMREFTGCDVEVRVTDVSKKKGTSIRSAPGASGGNSLDVWRRRKVGLELKLEGINRTLLGLAQMRLPEWNSS